MKNALLLSGALLLAGCAAVGPDYVRPNVDLSANYAFAHSPDLWHAANDRWWTALNDPLLNHLMEKGLAQNLEVKEAEARIEQAVALYRATGGVAQVSGNLTASATRRIRDGERTNPSFNDSVVQVDGNFAFDLFGRERRNRERAYRQLEATAYQAGTANLAFQSQLTSAVVQARFFQAIEAVTNRTIANRRRIVALTDEIAERGELTRVDRARARAELSLALADLPSIRNGLRRSAVQIATLLNEPVDPILHRLQQSRGQPAPSRTRKAGVPANLLRNRPDVLAAERSLAAAFSAIGVAEAQLYPELRLQGSIQLDSSRLDDVRFGPAVSLPLLSRGRLRAQRDAAVAEAKEAEFAWRQEIREAVGDVENALLELRSRREEIDARAQALADYRRLNQLSRETFELGVTTLLELLDADQEIRSVDLQLAQSRRDLALGVARLAVATGRGWNAGAAGPKPPLEIEDETIPPVVAPEPTAPAAPGSKPILTDPVVVAVR